ncbi:MAG: MBL fold metallo-hydrolase [Bacteroidales bacterium]|nr:MBL fold metallo-hydrolase [Bacteroidales bacterium]
MSGMHNIKIFSFNLFREHTMVLSSEGKSCVIIDPGFYEPYERTEFFDYINAGGLKPEAILLTHCHIDHIWGAKEVQDTFGIPLYMGPENREQFKSFDRMSSRMGITAPDYSFSVTEVGDNGTIDAGGFRFKVITTPGHSPGGVCYLEETEKIMFTGDTLFAGTIGRTDIMFAEYDDLIRSIMEKLIWLEPDIAIFPGHGPSSTIGVERTSNPFLEPFNEKSDEE